MEKVCRFANQMNLFVGDFGVSAGVRCFSFTTPVKKLNYVELKSSPHTFSSRGMEEFLEDPEECVSGMWAELFRDCAIHEYLLTEEKKGRPESVTVSGGNICNLGDCKMCFRRGVLSPFDNDKSFRKAVDALRRVQVETLVVSNFCEFMAYPWAAGFLQKPNEWGKAIVLTNGTTINKETIDSLPESVWFTVSIDGTTAEAYGRIRSGDYDLAMENARYLAAQNRLHLVDYTVTKDNIKDAYNIPGWAKANGFADRLFIGFDLNREKFRYKHSFRILANCLRNGCLLPENSERIRAYMSRFPDKDPEWKDDPTQA
jgi:hypothetical protein